MKAHEGLRFKLANATIIYYISKIRKKKIIEENSEIIVDVIYDDSGIIAPGSPVSIQSANEFINNGFWKILWK